MRGKEVSLNLLCRLPINSFTIIKRMFGHEISD